MATASLGRLTLDLVTKIGNFTGPMTQAERQAKSSSKNIANSFSVASIAATAFGAAVAGISIGGMAAFADQTIQTGSEIKKFAQLANTSVRDFQFYAKGAETAGISMESFADKMKDMQDRIGDFQQTGGGPLADFFENIAPLVGVTIQQFQKLSGPEALQLYYDSLQKVGASQNDLKFYMEAIISDSSLLIPLLENGGEGFKKWGDAAERANAIMSDEMIETLALAKENVQLLNLQWDGLKATLVNNVVPVVQLVSDNMDDIKAVALALTAAMAVKLVPTVVATSIQLAQLAAFSVRAGAGLIGLSASASTTTGAMVALRGAMAFLGGPAGLAMLAVQGIAAGSAFLYMKKSSDTLDPSLSTQGKTVAELRVEYEKLDTTQQRVLTRKATDELNEANKLFREQKNELLGLIDAVTRNSEVSEKDRDSASRLFEQYRLGKINSNELATAVNSLATISDTAKSSIDKKAESVGKEKSAVDDARKVLGIYSGKVQENTRLNNENAKSISAQEQALLGFTQKQREALKNISADIARENYIVANIAKGWSRDKANYFADAREDSGMSFSETSSKAWFLQVEAGYKLQQQTKAREDSEKKIAEVKEKQLASQKKMSELVGASALSRLRIKSGESVAGGKVRNYTAEFAKLTQDALGSDLTRFTAFNDLYHKGTNSRHATGNAFDFTVKNAKEATQAVKTLEEMAKRYGFTIKAINEYKTPSGRSTGGHVHVSVLGYKGEAEAIADAKAEVTLVRESMEDMEQVRTEILERQKTVRQQYFNEEKQMHEANKEAIKAIELAYAKGTPERAKYLGLQQAAYQKDVAEYQEAQKQKELSDKKQLLEASRNWMTAGDYAREYYALVREEILNTASYSPEMKEALLQQAVSQQNFEQSSERDQAISDYRDVMGYEENPLEQQFEVLQKMRELDLLNEEAYQNAKLELQAKSTAGYMEGMLGGFASLVDENSKTYAVLFAAQKAFAVAQAMLNIPAAYSKAYDAVVGTPYIGPYIAPAVGAAAAALQVAQAASIKGVGYADGGFTGHGGKYEPAGIVHRGEGVLTQEEIAALGGPSGFYALRQSIKNGFADGGIALDAPKVLSFDKGQDAGKYMSEVREQNHKPQTIDNNLRVIMVKDENEAKDWLYGPDGEKAFLYHMKRNRSKV